MTKKDVKDRDYKYCTIEFCDGRVKEAKVEYNPSINAWEPVKIFTGGKWKSMEKFEAKKESNICYGCTNYRTDFLNSK